MYRVRQEFSRFHWAPPEAIVRVTLEGYSWTTIFVDLAPPKSSSYFTLPDSQWAKSHMSDLQSLYPPSFPLSHTGWDRWLVETEGQIRASGIEPFLIGNMKRSGWFWRSQSAKYFGSAGESERLSFYICMSDMYDFRRCSMKTANLLPNSVEIL